MMALFANQLEARSTGILAGEWSSVETGAVEGGQHMSDEVPLQIFDCRLARTATGRRCANLRELLDAVRTAPDRVLEHHMLRCVLEDRCDLDDFPNEFARWCDKALGDYELAEQLALIDPYQHTSTASLRDTLADTLEKRLWNSGDGEDASCRHGSELHLIESHLVPFETGEQIETAAALAEALLHISSGSLYYHVHEARRRTGGATDDFSSWLEAKGMDGTLIFRIRAIDFYALNLNQLRREMLDAFGDYLIRSLPL